MPEPTMRKLLDITVAVLLAFVGFTLHGLGTDVRAATDAMIENRVEIKAVSTTLESADKRLERIEGQYDQLLRDER